MLVKDNAKICDCAVIPNLPILWSLFREEEKSFSWSGDLVHYYRRLPAALKSSIPIPRVLEV